MDSQNKELLPIRGSGEPLRTIFTKTGIPTHQKPERTGKWISFAASMCALAFAAVLFLNLVPLLAYADLRSCWITAAEDAIFRFASFRIVDTSLPDTFTDDASNPPSANSDTVRDSLQGEVPSVTLYPIQTANLSCGKNVHALFNETDYTPDTAALLLSPLPFERFSVWEKEHTSSEPYILILHTHATEAYAPEGSSVYSTDDTFRSLDPNENVVAVGAVMAETLQQAGIPVLHCTELFDAESYRDSYSRAAAAIRSYLSQYPSIRIVLDVHRDSVIRSDMSRIRPLTTVNGKECAQFMAVVGTDYKGADHPDWENNLNFALKIQQALIQQSTSFCRAINLRGAAFNEQYTDGSLLLEVGSCGNTLSQAKEAGILVAHAIRDVVQ